MEGERMAKKLTARQRKARKHAAYIKAEYYKNIDAIKYLRRFGIEKDIKIPKKITKKSLQAIRKVYKEARANVKEYEAGTGEYVDYTTGEVFQKLPTKAEMIKEYRAEERGEYERFDPDAQYIEELKDKIRNLTPLRDSDKTQKNYEKNVVPKQQKVKEDFLTAIDNAIDKYGKAIVADTLAKNAYMQRVGNLEEKYTYEIIDDVSEGDGNLIDLLVTSAEAAF